MKHLAALLSLVVALVLPASFATAQMNGGPFQNGVPTAPILFGVTDPNAGVYFGAGRVGLSRHVEIGSQYTPVLSACGTTPTLAAGSTDAAGTVTMGTTATGCVITFGAAYTAAPSCTITWRATPLASQSYTVTTTAVTLTQTSTSNNVIDYTCFSKTGG